VSAFVRPHGLGEAATPRFVAAIEALPGAARAAAGASGLFARAVLQLFRAVTYTKTGWFLMYDEAGAAKERRKEAERASVRAA